MNKANKTGFLNDDFKFFYLKDNNGSELDYHHHDFNKIVIFISGDVEYSIEGKTYSLKPWDILLINKNDIHKCNINKDVPYERVVIWLNDSISNYDDEDEDLLKCFSIRKAKQTNFLRLQDNTLKSVQCIMHKIFKYDKMCGFGCKTLKKSFLMQFLVIINQNYIKNNSLDNNIVDIHYDKTVEGIISFINKHLTENLSIDCIANHFNLNKHYTMRKFKKQTGSSIHSYILQKRLIKAKELMKTNSCMYSIAEECGFNDYSTFTRAFKKSYNLSPKKYFESVNLFEQIDIMQ